MSKWPHVYIRHSQAVLHMQKVWSLYDLKDKKKSASDKIKLLIWHGHGHIDHIFISDRLSCPNAYTRKIWRVWVLRQKGSAPYKIVSTDNRETTLWSQSTPQTFLRGFNNKLSNKQKYHTARTTLNLAPEFIPGF